MDAYMWHQQKQHPDAVHNGASANPATRNGAQNVNTQQWDGYGYGSAPTTTNAQQSYYDPGWMYEDFSGQMQQNISPAAILAQRAPNGSSHGPGAVMDGPTTIDPTLMMTSPYPHYISPQATQQAPHYPSHPRNTSYQQQQQQPSSYLPMPAADSALSAVIDYEPPQTSISPIDPSTNGLPHAGDTGTGTGGGTRVAPTEQPAALIDQVKKLLTPKQLDRDPQTSAQKLIDLLLPPSSSNTPTHADKDARLEILTRLRDHAPREVFVVLARNLPVLGLLREWGKNACKKEEFGETLMGWLQVVDKLPLTVETLAQSGLGKLIKYVVEHPPTTGESLLLLSSFLFFILLVSGTACGRTTTTRACCFCSCSSQQPESVLVISLTVTGDTPRPCLSVGWPHMIVFTFRFKFSNKNYLLPPNLKQKRERNKKDKKKRETKRQNAITSICRKKGPEKGRCFRLGGLLCFRFGTTWAKRRP
ncbi:hypothetical protein M408DRAFT_284290 [Serendipita vermifera MAFF 305830]|uniref:TFIIS N-terminal domain-containing protein n=1 Tax=Serendipita vermifera MAFF 305830 TaxID=933852 RepID=A0A0C2W7N4_SERVB|nr:hypothetical protein M408DRAFT_284290 [Serendipita vermifera MAFF 305830]